MGAGILRRRALGKKGRQVLERIVLRGSVVLREVADRRAEQVGFTRFFNNPRVSVKEILATSAARTAELSSGRHVLLIEDTSEINYQAKSGRKRALGPVGNGRDVGLFVHPALALDAADSTVLGLAGATIWRRSATKRHDYQSRPIETKESYRWLQTVAEARAQLGQPALVTMIADREADIYELFARLPDERTHLLIRAAHNRAVGDGGRLFTSLAGQPEAGRLAFDLPARPGRPARSVQLVVRFMATCLRQPRRGADSRDPKKISLNAVEVCEIEPPNPKEAVCWRLLTTHPVASLDDAITIVDLYRERWAIEQLFRTLKSQAIDIEASFIEDGEALERLAATALVAATAIMQIVHARGEAGRRLPATRVFTPHQIATLQALTPRLEGKTAKQKNPHPVETLAWAAWNIARLGGWTGYNTERPPGPITFSRGFQRFQAIADGYFLAINSADQDVCQR